MPNSSLSRRAFLKVFGLGVTSFALWPASRAVMAMGGPEPTALTDTAGDWDLAFSDDFTDPVRFEQQWLRVTSYGDFTETLRLPENVVVDSDGLDLMLGTNPRSEPKYPFSGGYIESRSFRQRYGYFECEMRIADEAGVNNAFWLVSEDETDEDVPFELDVAEAKHPNHVQVAARRWTRERAVVADTFETAMPLADDFHRYGMTWSPAEFRFYFDDALMFTAPNSFAHTPAKLRFSNAVADFAGEDDGDVDGAATSIRNLRVFINMDWAHTASLEEAAA